MRSRAGSLLFALGFVTIVTWPTFRACPAAEKDEQVRAALLEQMKGLAEQTKVKFTEKSSTPELVKTPVFRYDDQPRRFIDATVWAWTDNGRPVAFQKIEAMEYGRATTPSSNWQYCFSSVSEDLVSVEWPPSRKFRTTAPAVAFGPLSSSPAAAEGNVQRKRQARELIREFSAKISTDNTGSVQQMRLLTTPLLEYADPKTKQLLGTVFAFATNGTNPDLLVLLEVRSQKEQPAWHFAAARMTCGGVTLKHRESDVWKVDWAEGIKAPFPTWTFFATPRTKVEGEEEKP